MTLRVIQWATGNVGRAAIEGVLDHPDLELVGCWVHSAEKDGVDVGTLLGRDAVGVAATTDVDALLAAEADCVLYSPLFADPAVVTRILESGKNVVTPLGWFYPPAADVIRDWMLFGTTPEHARTSIMADALGGGFRQSVWMVADELGFAIDEHLRTTHEVAVATAPIDSPIGPIEPGMVAAQRFRWEGLVDGEPVVTAAVNWLMGDEHLDPPWAFGPEGERFEVEVTGDPGVFVTFKRLHPESIEAGLERNPGIVATAMHCVNAIPYVCAAPPGLLTY